MCWIFTACLKNKIKLNDIMSRNVLYIIIKKITSWIRVFDFFARKWTSRICIPRHVYKEIVRSRNKSFIFYAKSQMIPEVKLINIHRTKFNTNNSATTYNSIKKNNEKKSFLKRYRRGCCLCCYKALNKHTPFTYNQIII